MAFLDLFDQIVVTEFVKREFEGYARMLDGGEDQVTEYGPRILAQQNHNGRHVRVRYQDILGVGLAQFKAPGAQPALWTMKPNLRERFMEMVDIDEMHRIDPIEIMNLESPDPNVLDVAQISLADRATAMARRNDQRTEWMRWEALKGVMVVPYPNAAPVTINYGIPSENFPTFGTPWTDLINADPIEDLWALGAVSVTVSGVYLQLHHMSWATNRLMIRSKKIRDQMSSYGRDVMIPNDRDINALMREGSEIVKTDAGYLSENSTNKKLNTWIPEGKVFTTVKNYRYGGREIGSVKDGWVLVGGATTATRPVPKQGMQSEWIYNRVTQETLFRQASARMVVINSPEVLAWGTAYTP